MSEQREGYGSTSRLPTAGGFCAHQQEQVSLLRAGRFFVCAGSTCTKAHGSSQIWCCMPATPCDFLSGISGVRGE